jgi:excisionase family DNA binding protein
VNATKVQTADAVLTVDEVAARLRLTRHTVIKLVEQGELPAIRLGKLYRFDSRKIAALFDADRS